MYFVTYVNKDASDPLDKGVECFDTLEKAMYFCEYFDKKGYITELYIGKMK